MLNDGSTVFTDRRKAICLFNEVRSRRNPEEAWPLLPILVFLGTGGSGKSFLFEHLCTTECSLADGPNGRAVMPYAYLDFTQPNMKLDLLAIFMELRDQLQKHKDAYGKHLVFRRFDFGAKVALASQANDINAFIRDEQKPTLVSRLFKPINDMGNALGNLIPFLPPILLGSQWVAHIFSASVSLFRNQSAWQWYRTLSTDLQLPPEASRRQISKRLRAINLFRGPGNRGREYLIEYVLPRAFVADLLDAFNHLPTPRAWSSVVPAVVFLDGFEKLVDAPGDIGTQLLRGLAITDHRRRGETDPLLLVIGSQKRLFECSGYGLITLL